MVEPEAELNWQQRLANWGYTLLQIIDLRLAIALAVAAFLLAVGVDSSGNLASASALDAAVQQQAFEMSAPRLKVEPESPAQQTERLEVANRLRHSEMVHASMTSSHLTRAHLFSDFSALR
ncbi:hypothetical protein C7271_14765 [filamentous cyanobacterium CCP5]|nr:hypothetical protein C7271_14765 [filamentous cyanobacterium CCP5]